MIRFAVRLQFRNLLGKSIRKRRFEKKKKTVSNRRINQMIRKKTRYIVNNTLDELKKEQKRKKFSIIIKKEVLNFNTNHSFLKIKLRLRTSNVIEPHIYHRN